jgi:hypothetical protein
LISSKTHQKSNQTIGSDKYIISKTLNQKESIKEGNKNISDFVAI